MSPIHIIPSEFNKKLELQRCIIQCLIDNLFDYARVHLNNRQ